MNSLPRSGAASLLIHGGLLSLLLGVSRFGSAPPLIPPVQPVTPIVLPVWRAAVKHDAGGNTAGNTTPPQGSAPRRATKTFIAPIVERPRLPPEVAVEAPDIPLESRLMNIGDPLSSLVGGVGLGIDYSGIGTHGKGGIGKDNGPGL
jgi:hypothetical protein